MNFNSIPPIDSASPVRSPLDYPGQLSKKYEGRLFKKNDPLRKKQLGVEKAIFQLEDKIRTSKPAEVRLLKVELKELKRLRYSFLGKQVHAEKSLIGRICSLGKYFVSSSKQFTLEKAEASHFQKHVAKVFGKEVWNIGQRGKVRLVRAGRDLSYADLIQLTKQRIDYRKRVGLPVDDAESLLLYLNKTQSKVKQDVSGKQFVATKFRGAFSFRKKLIPK